MKKVIEKALRNYKKNKAIIDIAYARIEAWEAAIKNPDIILDVLADGRSNDSWIGGSIGGSIIDSPVEKEVLRKLSDVEDEAAKQERCVNLLQEYIKREKAKIFWIELEVKQIEKALDSLTEQEIYIVKCKYFENMTWNMIEVSLNQQFRDKDYITVSWMKKINSVVLEQIVDISI